MRIIVPGVVAAGLLLHGVLAAAQQPAAPVTISLPTKPLRDALNSLARQTGLQVIYTAEEVTAGLTAPSLEGSFTAESALNALLKNSGLTFEFLNARTVAITVADANKLTTTQAPALQRLRLAQAATSERGEEVGKAAPARDTEKQSVQLEEIIVTATKRQERLQDVPLSIAVISNQDIERRGLIGMEDYLRSIPGVNQIDNGPFTNAIVIRGVTTSPEFENNVSSPTVASYFDETPITGMAGIGAGGIDVRPVDIERIEVLRGPQGTAFGSSSLGGALRIIPVKPKLDAFSAKLAALYSSTAGPGSENTMIQSVLNIPLVADHLALRAVGYRYDESGFYRNIAGVDAGTIAYAERFGLGDFVRGHVEDDVGRMLSTGGRLAASWQPTDELNLSMTFLTQTIEQDGFPFATDGKYEQTQFPAAPQGRVRGEDGELADTKLDLLSLVLNYDLGWAGLTSAASWTDGGSVWVEDLSLFRLPASSTAFSDVESFIAETRLASQLPGRLQFLGGLYYENADDDYYQTLDYPGTPAFNPFGANPLLLHIERTRDLDHRALFGEVSYDLTEKLTATAGARFFEYKRNVKELQEGAPVSVPIGAGVVQNFRNKESNNSFKTNLSYQPTKDTLLYASWSEGFRLGMPVPGLSSYSAICDRDSDGLVDGTSLSIESTKTVKADFLENYEIGAKFALFERRMVIDASIYRINWDGLPARTSAACGDVSTIYTANVGSATSEGMEFQTALFVTTGLRLELGGGYTKAQITKDAPAQGWHRGDRLPGAPKVNVNLAAQYDFDVAGLHAFIRTDSLYAGKFFGDFSAAPDTMAGNYIKVDARAGVTITRNLSIELFARNLTDQDAFTWRSQLDGPGPFAGYRMKPRTVGVQVGYSFGRQ